MRTLGLDIGDATIGIARTDLLGITAQGVETYRRESIKKDVKYLETMIIKDQVDVVVYGLPVYLDGNESEQTKKTKAFIKALQKKITYSGTIKHQVKLVAVDERLTSAQAHAAMKMGDVKRRDRDKIVDMIAAQLILEHYLAMENTHE